MATSCAEPLKNYLVLNKSAGIYGYAYEADRNETCVVCSGKPQTLRVKRTDKLKDVVEYLTDHAMYQMKAPGLTTTTKEGKNRTLYMSKVRGIF